MTPLRSWRAVALAAAAAVTISTLALSASWGRPAAAAAPAAAALGGDHAPATALYRDLWVGMAAGGGGGGGGCGGGETLMGDIPDSQSEVAASGHRTGGEEQPAATSAVQTRYRCLV